MDIDTSSALLATPPENSTPGGPYSTILGGGGSLPLRDYWETSKLTASAEVPLPLHSGYNRRMHIYIYHGGSAAVRFFDLTEPSGASGGRH